MIARAHDWFNSRRGFIRILLYAEFVIGLIVEVGTQPPSVGAGWAGGCLDGSEGAFNSILNPPASRLFINGKRRISNAAPPNAPSMARKPVGISRNPPPGSFVVTFADVALDSVQRLPINC